MIKFRNHQTANSFEFRNGAPGLWPQVEERVPDAYALSDKEKADGFSLLSESEWFAIRSDQKAAWDAWESTRKTTELAAEDTDRTEQSSLITTLTALAASSGTLSASQLSSGLRSIASGLLRVLRR